MRGLWVHQGVGVRGFKLRPVCGLIELRGWGLASAFTISAVRVRGFGFRLNLHFPGEPANSKYAATVDGPNPANS